VTKMQIGGGRVQAELDLEGRPGAAGALELLGELGLHDDVSGTAPDCQKLLVYRAELRDAQSTRGCITPVSRAQGNGRLYRVSHRIMFG